MIRKTAHDAAPSRKAQRKVGVSATAATSRLEWLSVADKNELLFSHGINFNALPAWQRRGIGVVWEAYEKAGVNPKTSETTTAQRRRLGTVMELPMQDADNAFVALLVHDAA